MKKLVVLTGSGISAESGIPTYRDENGLWTKHDHKDVASPEGWKKDREKVLRFWNELRKLIDSCVPNQAHFSLFELEKSFEVTIITQNVDDLHERAGSSNVIHLHGEITKARSSLDRKLVYDWSGKDISIGDKCGKGSQLRPHVVWFGEQVPLFEVALNVVKQADIMLVIGTSLKVFPAANLVSKRRSGVPLYIVDPKIEADDCITFEEPATVGVPMVAKLLVGTN